MRSMPRSEGSSELSWSCRQSTRPQLFSCPCQKARQAESAEKQGRHQAEYESYMANIAAADSALASDDGGAALRRLDEAPMALRNWEWRFLKRAADQSIATIHGPQNRELKHIGISPDGRFIAGVAEG